MADQMEPMTYRLSLTTHEGETLNSWVISLFLIETEEPSLNMLKATDRMTLLDQICTDIAWIERTHPADKK